MVIAIHPNKTGFAPRWIEYCKTNGIEYRLVNCYANDIIDQLRGCDALMWHFHNLSAEDMLIAQKILFSLQHAGIKVFPDFNTAWHFEDKIAQKYIVELFGLPHVKSFVFFNKAEALKWVEQTSFPKVFKLRGGAGSINVKLARTKSQGKKLVEQSFGKGFKQYDPFINIKERWRKFRSGSENITHVIKGVGRIFYVPEYSRVAGKELGYAYFQEFIPNNTFDIRVIVIDKKAFALKRYVRENDFRASGSGNFAFAREEFDERCIKLSFEANQKIQSQSLALDFVFDEGNNPLIVEMSYGFTPSGYDECPGYWDENMAWHEGSFNPQGWMVKSLVEEINSAR